MRRLMSCCRRIPTQTEAGKQVAIIAFPTHFEERFGCCSVGLPISYSRDERRARTLTRNGSGLSGILDGWPRKRPGSRLMRHSLSSPNPAGKGDGGGAARLPWMQERLAPPELSLWGHRLTTGMATTVTVVSTVAFTAVVVMRAVAGFSGDMKGASPEGRPDTFGLVRSHPYWVMRLR